MQTQQAIQAVWRARRRGPAVRCLVSAVIVAVWFAFAGRALAQAPAPTIGYIFPAGAQRGTTVLLTVAGQFLNGATNVLVSGSGVSGVVAEYNKPMPMGQFNMLRDKFLELQQRKQAALRNAPRRLNAASDSTNVWTAADEKMLVELREKILKNAPNRQATPALAETVKIEVTLAPDAEPGEREIRLGTQAGLTNPRKFVVGVLPEISKPHSTPPNPALDRFRQRVPRGPLATRTNVETQVTLPAVLNGQILPGEVDRFRFSARRGQRLVFVASARDLIPYLADAVPGWFQATLAVFDSQGHELAYCDDYMFNPDPALSFAVPKTGEYVLEIRDAIYRGREDFVYRITAGELPFVTSVFPLGGRVGTTSTISLKGWNLPSAETARTNDAPVPSVQFVSVDVGQHPSNRAPFAIDDLPECVDKEPNDLPAMAQKVELPVIANGRIDGSADKDLFGFSAKKGDTVVAEVRARHLNSPLDSFLQIIDAAGAVVASSDDWVDKGAGLATHHADSYLAAVLPADGDYFVCLTDTQRHGGPDHAYRLRISPPMPDFDLRVVPSTLTIRGGTTVPLTIHALRKDGFNGEIVLRLAGDDHGFKLAGARVPAGQDMIRVTLAAPAGPLAQPVNLAVEGLAVVRGQPAARKAVPADDMMQAFAYRHLVPAHELKVAVIGRAQMRPPTFSLGAGPLKIPIGGGARVRLEGSNRNPGSRFQLELDDPPPGIILQDLVTSGGPTEIELRCNNEKAQAGLKGNLIVKVLAAGDRTGRRPQAGQRRAPIGYLPAIPFEIVDSEKR